MTGGPTRYLSPAEVAEQKRHDSAHPGKVCRTCPVTVAQRESFERRARQIQRRRQTVQTWLIGLLLVAGLLFAGWLQHHFDEQDAKHAGVQPGLWIPQDAARPSGGSR